MKILEFENMFNVRDIGGYKCQGNKTIKYNKLIRSDAPKEMSDENIEYLLSNNIKTEIDLRTEFVTKNHPSTLQRDGRFNYHRVSINYGSQETLGTMPTYELYMKMCNDTKAFYDVFRLIVDEKDGIYLNCTAGKDRTGMVVAILMLFLGVDEEDVFHDYEVSAPLIDSKILKYASTHPGFPTSLGVSNYSDIYEWYALFIKKYGSAKNYLLSIGLTTDDLNVLKNKFLV